MKLHGSLKNILTLNFFLIAVVPVLIIGGVVLSILSGYLTYDIAEKNSLLVKTLGREVETSLENSEATLRQLADIIDQGSVIEKESLNSHLNSIIKHHEELEMVRLLDVNGVVTHIAPFSSSYIGINMSYQPFIQATMTNLKSQWSSTFRSSKTRYPTIALSIPLNNGILVGYLNLKNLKAIADKIKIGTLGYAYIVDNEGTFIAHPNQAYVAEQTNLKNVFEITRQPIENKKIFTFEIQGEEVFSSSTTVPRVNWGITIIQPVEEAFISYNKIKETILAGIFVTLGFVMFLIIIIPKKILQPLFQLTEYSKQVAAGDVSIFNYQKSYLEVNDLAKNFDIMIEALKNRENELRRSKEKAQKYLDTAKVILIALSKDKSVSLINRKGCEVLGYREDEIVGHEWCDTFLPERYRVPVSTFYDKMMKGKVGGAEGKETPILRKDGQERILLWHNTIIKNEAGEITGTLSSGEDITERKKAESALRESEERYKLATKASDNGIWDWWTHSEEIYYSDQWKAQLGYEPHELENKLSTWENMTHPECKSRMMNRLQEFLSSPSGYFIEEFRMQHKDGTYRWIANKASAVLKDGKVVRMFGSHTDITDRKDNEKVKKALETQIAQSQKLESLGVMAGGIAHNFNNNLAIILGNNELLELEVQNNSFALSCLEDSTVAIKRSKDLIDQILTFSKRGTIESPPNFIVPVFNETITLLKSSLPGAVEISVEIDVKVEDKIVFINPSQLQEVIINLSNNAVYAMKEQGELSISIALQVLSQENIPVEHHHLKPGEFVELKVADSGPGIPKKIIDKIFDPFFTTKPVHEGTGMGLSLVQGIVNHSKGFIKVDRDRDEGSTFTLYFKTTTDLPVIEEESLSEIKGKRESILLVDDEPSLAKLGARLLERNGYQVTPLTNPEEALEIIKKDPFRFQLVISDQLMPQMTGDKLLDSILEINPNIKTIICSGNIDKVDQNIVEKVGVEFVLKKPLNHKNLLKKIRILFDR